MKWQLKGVLFSIFCTTLSIQVQAETLLACDRPGTAGLYKQCQEVAFIQKVGSRARVFGRVDKKVSIVEISALFVARHAVEAKLLSNQMTISVPGSLLWNNTPEGYQSLCVLKASSQKLLDVECGRRKNETVSRENAYVITPFDLAVVKPTALHYSKK